MLEFRSTVRLFPYVTVMLLNTLYAYLDVRAFFVRVLLCTVSGLTPAPKLLCVTLK
jgi:hypothetical protein